VRAEGGLMVEWRKQAIFTTTDIIFTKNIFSKQQMRETQFQMILILAGQFL
jgi:hypothetical protein